MNRRNVKNHSKICDSESLNRCSLQGALYHLRKRRLLFSKPIYFMKPFLPILGVLWCVSLSCAAQKAEIDSILKVGPEGANNEEATKAVSVLSKAPAEQIPQLLLAMNHANEIALNYLRSVVDVVMDRAMLSKSPVPVAEIRNFLLNTENHPRARRLAYEMMVRTVPEEAMRLLPGFANDPSVELRYDAVELLIGAADEKKKAGDNDGAKAAYQKALNAARQQKQIEKVAAELRALGDNVDLSRHFGFLARWKVIGPFDNTNLTGFDTVYPPEKEMLPEAEYDGKSGRVRWSEVSTGDDYGKVDLNPVLGELKEVTGYATTVFNSPVEGPAELRLGCKNGWKVWMNGTFLFGRDEYHRGARIDQYRLPVTLKKGANTILLKVCQNADVKDWTKEWEFQLRVCDSTGTAILATDRPEAQSLEPKAKTKPKKAQK